MTTKETYLTVNEIYRCAFSFIHILTYPTNWNSYRIRSSFFNNYKIC